MKDFNDIISRFDEIPDLPVSEEMLGAYMEGRYAPNSPKALAVENAMADDPDFASFAEGYDEIGNLSIENAFDSDIPSLDSWSTHSDIENLNQFIDSYDSFAFGFGSKLVAAIAPEIAGDSDWASTLDSDLDSNDILENNFGHDDSFSVNTDSFDIDTQDSDVDMFDDLN